MPLHPQIQALFVLEGFDADRDLSDPKDARNRHAAPLRAPDLRGLPAGLVITAEYGVLRDEGELYAGRLRKSGVPTGPVRY